MAETLDDIEKDILNNTELPLCSNGKLVFGKGNPKADILFIGEAAGAKEAEQGKPFVGAAGKQLDSLLHSIGLTLDDVYITNVLKYRPPNNRNPTEEEMVEHTPYLVRQIKAVRPKVICTLGNFATKFVLAGFDVKDMRRIPGISGLHGKPKHMSVDGFSFVAIPLYHPAAMLYNRSLEETMKKDFRIVKEYSGERKSNTLLDY